MLFIDTETTGTKAGYDEILSIAIVDDAGQVLLDTYLTPTRKTTWPEAQAINGISPEFIRDGQFPTAPDMAEMVRGLLASEPVVAYNLGFDQPMLSAASMWPAELPPNLDYCCMLRYAKFRNDPNTNGKRGPKWHKLAVAAEHTGHVWTGKAHGALADTLACRHVWQWLDAQLPVLDFSSNWNGKLTNQSFTTFRLHSKKYQPGNCYEIRLKGKALKVARCVDVKPMRLSDVNPWISNLDTGYSLTEFNDLVRTIYKNIVKDFDSQLFDLVLLETEK